MASKVMELKKTLKAAEEALAKRKVRKKKGKTQKRKTGKRPKGMKVKHGLSEDDDLVARREAIKKPSTKTPAVATQYLHAILLPHLGQRASIRSVGELRTLFFVMGYLAQGLPAQAVIRGQRPARGPA